MSAELARYEHAEDIPEHVVTAFDVAAGCWPGSFEPGSTGVRIAWAPALAPYSLDELCTCFEAMAATSRKFPPLADVLAGLRERRSEQSREEQRARLAPPPPTAPGWEPWQTLPSADDGPLFAAMRANVRAGMTHPAALSAALRAHPLDIGRKGGRPAPVPSGAPTASDVDPVEVRRQVDAWKAGEVSDAEMAELAEPFRSACRVEARRRARDDAA